MTTLQKKRNLANIKTKKTESRGLKEAIVKTQKDKTTVYNKEYKKLHTVEQKTYLTEYRKLNAAKIKNVRDDYQKRNTGKIENSRNHYRKRNAGKIKTEYQVRKEAMYTKYHIQKAVKLDAAEKQTEQVPGSRKVLSLSVIKKAIHKKFRFGKNHVDVQNCKGNWIHAKRIRMESTSFTPSVLPDIHLVDSTET